MSVESNLDVTPSAIKGLLAEAKHAGDKAFVNCDKFGEAWYSGMQHAFKLILKMEAK